MSVQRAKEVIRQEAEAIEGLSGRVDESFERAVELIMGCKGRVIVTGMGKSGIVAQKIASTLASTGTAAFFLHAAEGAHGDLGLVQRDDVVVMISKSGDTDELLRLLPLFRRLGVPIISLSGNPNSLLATKSDLTLDCSVDSEVGSNDLVPTASTTAAMVMGDALAIAILERRGFGPQDLAYFHPGGSIGRRLLLTVEDLMLKDEEVPIVAEDTPMMETILVLTGNRGVTTVVDEEGKLCGIFVYGDLGRLLERRKDIFGLKVRDVMITDPKTIHQERLAAEALRLMEKHGITCLVVVDGGERPIGIIHLHDILRSGVF